WQSPSAAHPSDRGKCIRLPSPPGRPGTYRSFAPNGRSPPASCACCVESVSGGPWWISQQLMAAQGETFHNHAPVLERDDAPGGWEISGAYARVGVGEALDVFQLPVFGRKIIHS